MPRPHHIAHSLLPQLLWRLLPRPCNWPYNWLERIVYAFRPPRPDFSRKDFFWFRDAPHPRPYYRPKGGAT